MILQILALIPILAMQVPEASKTLEPKIDEYFIKSPELVSNSIKKEILKKIERDLLKKLQNELHPLNVDILKKESR